MRHYLLQQLAGLALTPDGSLLLAADLLDGSLGVINLNDTSASYAIPIAPLGNNGNLNCTVGPLYVAAAAGNQAVVVTGGMPGVACGPGGARYLVNLSARTVGWPATTGFCNATVGAHVSATSNGGKVAIGGSVGSGGGFCIYDPVARTYAENDSYQTYGAAFSADGNVAASQFVFTDAAADVIGRVARPEVLYPGTTGAGPNLQSAQPNLEEPRLNDAGSLYYLAYPNGFEIVDVQHGILLLRFALSETVPNTAAPMAIDSGGRMVFLITDRGLTVVDLGEAPLSIGWLSASSAGSQVTVRGSGFNASTTVTVGGQPAAVTFTDENTLTLTIPPVVTGVADIVLTNSNGVSYRLEGALTIR